MPHGAELQNEWGFLSTGSRLGPPSYTRHHPTQPIPCPWPTSLATSVAFFPEWLVYCCSLYPPVFSHCSFPPQSLGQFPNLVELWTFCTRPAVSRSWRPPAPVGHPGTPLLLAAHPWPTSTCAGRLTNCGIFLDFVQQETGSLCIRGKSEASRQCRPMT